MPKFDEAAYLRLIRGGSSGPLDGAARRLLSAASLPYGWVVSRRNRRFDRGEGVASAGVPVVSVGNLTLGGTGKTPMVEWIARWLRGRALRVAILSRGYGQAGGINDEGRVLEENLPDVPHLQGKDRVGLARVAVEELETEVLVLDDGFQHRRMARDLDVVLIDALEPFGLGRLVPRGLLREPVSSLRRAGVVVLSRADLVPEGEREAIRSEAERRAGPLAWAEARHAPIGLMGGPGGDLGTLKGARVAAFCGIGNPEGFRRTLVGLGAEVVGFRAFPDHHPYGVRDVSDLAAWARSAGAEVALTTQKDSVKLRVEALGPIPLRSVRIGLDVIAGEGRIVAALEGAIGR